MRRTYSRRGRDGEIYSIHAPGLPALVAPAFALGGYRGVVLFLMLLAAAGSALAWQLAWLVTGRTDAAWFGWAAVTLLGDRALPELHGLSGRRRRRRSR